MMHVYSMLIILFIASVTLDVLLTMNSFYPLHTWQMCALKITILLVYTSCVLYCSEQVIRHGAMQYIISLLQPLMLSLIHTLTHSH